MQTSTAVSLGNLFADADPPASGERFEQLLAQRNLVIERIVSAAGTPATEYVQEQDEWVALLQGGATLEVAGQEVQLRPGDYLFLPAGTPHVVRRVAAGSLWLAVHLYLPPASGRPEVHG